MLRPGGYVSIHDEEGRLLREGDTFTCAHGNEIVRAGVGFSSVEGAFCARCDQRICAKCAREMAKTGDCIPTEKMIQRMENRPTPDLTVATQYICGHGLCLPASTVKHPAPPLKRFVRVPVGTDPGTVGAFCPTCGSHLCEVCASRWDESPLCPPFERKLADYEDGSRFSRQLVG